MKKWKKITLIVLAIAVALGGILGGALSVSADEEDTPVTGGSTLIEKVAEIYERNTGTALDSSQLKAAFEEARQETFSEKRTELFTRLVENGIITQEEADEFKAWLDEMPDIDLGRIDNIGEKFFDNMPSHDDMFNRQHFHIPGGFDTPGQQE